MNRALRGWLVGVCLLAGCTGGQSLVLVSLQTDFVPGIEFDQVAVLSPRGREVTAAGSADYLTARRITELQLRETARAELEVTLLYEGQEVARRTAVFAVQGTTSLTLLVTRDCRGVMCSEGTTCVGGRCQDSTCVTGEEAACEGECEADGDCPDLDLCATRHCTAGSCVYRADDRLCRVLEVCIPESGCETRSPVMSDAGPPDAGFDAGPSDAGPPDAGPPDAGPCADLVCPSNQTCRAGTCGPVFDCTPLPGDGDGDGIPDTRDPWPARCNTLVDYQVLPGLEAPWNAPAGSVETRAGATLATGNLNASFTAPRLYVESTFTLGAIADEDDWGVFLRVDSDAGEILICHPYRVLQVDIDWGGMGPRLRLAWQPADPIPEGEGIYRFPEHSADFAAGQRYTLQMWRDLEGHITCQLANNVGPVGVPTTTRGGGVPAISSLAGLLRVGVKNRTATFERILVVEP